jgi:hypothetical protein
MMLLVLEVLRLVVTAEQEQDKIRDQYAYREVQLNLPKRSRTYDVIRLNGQPYRKLVELNGKPLSEKESKQVQDNMRKTARGLFSRTYRMNLGKLSDLENTHELSLEGNLITATPKSGGPYKHRITFDPQTHRILTRQSEVVGPGSQFKAGTTIQLDFSPEGFLQKMDIDFKVKFGGGKQIHTFTNYRKFDAESTINFEDPK